LTPTTRLDEAIDTLTNNALIDYNWETGLLSIHRLTQETFIHQEDALGFLILQRAFNHLLGLLARKFPSTDQVAHSDYWEQYTKYTPQVYALAQAYKRFHITIGSIQVFVSLLINTT